MLDAAFLILAIAALLGAVLFVMHLRNSGAAVAAPARLAALHGFLGLAGLVCLVLALRASPPRIDQGTAGFDAISVVVLGLAALLGGIIFAIRLSDKSRGGALMGIHATLAVGGLVILAAYVLV